jgi:hypothetical protein
MAYAEPDYGDGSTLGTLRNIFAVAAGAVRSEEDYPTAEYWRTYHRGRAEVAAVAIELLTGESARAMLRENRVED